MLTSQCDNGLQWISFAHGSLVYDPNIAKIGVLFNSNSIQICLLKHTNKQIQIGIRLSETKNIQMAFQIKHNLILHEHMHDHAILLM